AFCCHKRLQKLWRPLESHKIPKRQRTSQISCVPPDGSALFTKALGLELDATAGGLGIRSKRYSAIVEDGVVKTLNIEEQAGQAATSSAATLIEQL
ncbi:MAG TPA: redoxin family protein, partial [Ochrobactrum sp.]|nr:redoxin family protein [Ochrobactrum sp.]